MSTLYAVTHTLPAAAKMAFVCPLGPTSILAVTRGSSSRLGDESPGARGGPASPNARTTRSMLGTAMSIATRTAVSRSRSCL
jgi:hypothetical protein